MRETWTFPDFDEFCCAYRDGWIPKMALFVVEDPKWALTVDVQHGGTQVSIMAPTQGDVLWVLRVFNDAEAEQLQEWEADRVAARARDELLTAASTTPTDNRPRWRRVLTHNWVATIGGGLILLGVGYGWGRL